MYFGIALNSVDIMTMPCYVLVYY